MVSSRHVLTLAALIAVCGCKQFASTPNPNIGNAEATATERPANLPQHVRNNCASLLYDLLNDEKNLSKILIIKRESDDLHQVVKSISTTAADAAKQLEQIARSDASLNLKVMSLPSGEAATRQAISKTKEHELLHSKGADFQFKLLLTQTEGLNYGVHLAKVAARNESRPENIRVFAGIQANLAKLYLEVCNQLRRNDVAEPADKTE